MQSDIKSKSTDFLPPKPGDDSSGAQNSQPDSPMSAPPTPQSSTKPTSKHVIDLKNMDSSPKSSKDFMVSQKPTEPTPPPAPVMSSPAEVSQPELSESTDNPVGEPSKQAIDVPVGMKPINENPSVSTPEPPQAHQDQDLKDAMVNLDPSKPTHQENPAQSTSQASAPTSDSQDSSMPKQKKKFPTWALVLVIVVIVIIIAVGTFYILNSVAPTSLG